MNMDKITNKIESYLYKIIYSAMVFSLSYLTGIPIGINFIIPLQIVIVLAITSIVYLFITYKILLFILFLCILVGFIIASYFFKTFVILFFSKAYFLFDNILSHLKGHEKVLPENRLLFWAMIIVLLSIFTWFVIYKLKRIYFLLPIYAGGILYYWYNYYDAAYWMMVLFLFLYLILFGLNKHLYMVKNKQLSQKFQYLHNSRINIIVNYSIIIVFLSLLLPKSSYKLDLNWLNDKVNEVFPSIKQWRSSEDSSKDSDGFQDISSNGSNKAGYSIYPSRLGGPIVLDDRAVIVVYGEGPIYMRGIVRHTYTGTHWLTEDENWKRYNEWEDYISEVAEEESQYYEEVEYLVINRSSVKTIFSPYRLKEVDYKILNDLKVSQDDIVTTSIPIESGEKYILTTLKPLTYKELVDLGIDRKKEDLKDKSLYLQVPEDKISYFTRELTKEIVKGAKTDLEKAKAIESYLRANYKYTLEVEPVPEGVDFVDYFLFHSKEGYCTYYATAMAIMLRLEGIPTRYVEGFLVNEPVQDGIYVVRNYNAHAWVEAFIEPVGWMTFEPTSVYPLVSNVDGNSNSDLEDYYNNVSDYNIDVGQIIGDDENLLIQQENIQDIGENTIENDSSLKFRKAAKIVLGVLLLGLFIRIITKVIKMKYHNVKIRKMPNRDKIIYLYNDIMKLIELKGIVRETGETHYEFANRIVHKLPYRDEGIGIVEVTEVFVRNKYGNVVPSDEDMAIINEYMDILKKYIKSSLGMRTYLYKKYFK